MLREGFGGLVHVAVVAMQPCVMLRVRACAGIMTLAQGPSLDTQEVHHHHMIQDQ